MTGSKEDAEKLAAAPDGKWVAVPTPLEVGPDPITIMRDGVCIAFTSRPEDAARIVACVNFCSALSTEQLQDSVKIDRFLATCRAGCDLLSLRLGIVP